MVHPSITSNRMLPASPARSDGSDESNTHSRDYRDVSLPQSFSSLKVSTRFLGSNQNAILRSEKVTNFLEQHNANFVLAKVRNRQSLLTMEEKFMIVDILMHGIDTCPQYSRTLKEPKRGRIRPTGRKWGLLHKGDSSKYCFYSHHDYLGLCLDGTISGFQYFGSWFFGFTFVTNSTPEFIVIAGDTSLVQFCLDAGIFQSKSKAVKAVLDIYRKHYPLRASSAPAVQANEDFPDGFTVIIEELVRDTSPLQVGVIQKAFEAQSEMKRQGSGAKTEKHRVVRSEKRQRDARTSLTITGSSPTITGASLTRDTESMELYSPKLPLADESAKREHLLNAESWYMPFPAELPSTPGITTPDYFDAYVNVGEYDLGLLEGYFEPSKMQVDATDPSS